MSSHIISGAEPISITDGTHGAVLLLHGYTGTPQQIRPWAEAFAQAGFAVEAPLLPGHGTVAEELIDTRLSDYIDCAETCLKKLAERYQHVFVGGLCLGGNIATWLAIKNPTKIAALMVVNGHFKAPRVGNPESFQALLKSGKQFFTWSTLPKQVEDLEAPAVIAYNKVAIAPMTTFRFIWTEVSPRLSEIHCPVIDFMAQLSPKTDQDDTWFQAVSGPVEHVLLERSNSIATLDYDKDIIAKRSIALALAVTNGEYDDVAKYDANDPVDKKTFANGAYGNLDLDKIYAAQEELSVE